MQKSLGSKVNHYHEDVINTLVVNSKLAFNRLSYKETKKKFRCTNLLLYNAQDNIMQPYHKLENYL